MLGIGLQKVGLPDGGGTIGGIRATTLGDVAHELPCAGPVRTSVEIDTRAGVAPAVSGAENGASFEASHGFGQFRECGLSTHAPAVDLVMEVRDVLPSRATVLALEDGKVAGRMSHQRSSGNDGAILQFNESRIRDRFASSCLVDGIVGEVTPWLGAAGLLGHRPGSEMKQSCCCH